MLGSPHASTAQAGRRADGGLVRPARRAQNIGIMQCPPRRATFPRPDARGSVRALSSG
ncbi:hypothetical protein HMPREF9062_0691 [Actinomyces sp. oral taxon 448 str. F0400]|nr:hypothetical protein HMPREF9062_0691 [Actinomyces sp. oral taxon 448 str. F0400]